MLVKGPHASTNYFPLPHFTLAFIKSFRWQLTAQKIYTDYLWPWRVYSQFRSKNIVRYSDVTPALRRLKSPVTRLINYLFTNSSGLQQGNYQTPDHLSLCEGIDQPPIEFSIPHPHTTPPPPTFPWHHHGAENNISHTSVLSTYKSILSWINWYIYF